MDPVFQFVQMLVSVPRQLAPAKLVHYLKRESAGCSVRKLNGALLFEGRRDVKHLIKRR